MLKLSADFIRRYTNHDERSLLQRLPNPTGTGWAIIATAGVAALVLASTAFADGGTPNKKPLPDVEPDLECDPTPYEVDTDEIRAAIGAAIGQGERDRAIIATNVAVQFFAAHPAGGAAAFPPGPNPLPGVLCVWSVVIFLVDDEFELRGLGNIEVPEEPEGPTGSLVWVTRGSGDPGYPWEEPVLQTANYPTPGMFVDINGPGAAGWHPSDGYEQTMRAYLKSALTMAGADASLANASGGIGQSLRKQARDAITAVGGFNDLLYGQTSAEAAGGEAAYYFNAEGRSLNWYPYHHNVIGAIAQGTPPARGTRINGSKLPGGKGGSEQMVVWLPAVDLDALRDGVFKFLTWSDGSSTLDPPPQIRNLGVNMNGVVLPGV